MVDKQSLRKQLLSQRQALSAGEVRHRTSVAFENFQRNASLLLPDQYEAVALYYPIQGEVDARLWFKYFSKIGKKCVFPKVVNQELNFFHVQDWGFLRAGPFGIGEPQPKPGESSLQPDLVFVPGIAFSRDAHRLGFGAGYYDRVIEKWMAGAPVPPRLIGLAYDFQLLDQLPVDPHDRPMDYIVTEQFLISGKPK